MTITKLLKNSWLHLKKIITHKYYVAKYYFKDSLFLSIFLLICENDK